MYIKSTQCGNLRFFFFSTFFFFQASSGIRSVTLNRNSSHEMLKIDKKKANFPLILSFNFAVTSPLTEELFDDDTDENQEAIAAGNDVAQVENVT